MADVNTEETTAFENDDGTGTLTKTKDENHSEEAAHDDDEIKHDGHSAGAASSQPTQHQKSKIDVLLKSAGDAPIMKKKKWAVDRTKRVSWISEFIRKYIKLEISESLFLYVNQSFSPSPDTEVGVLFDCFGSDGKLVLHYCRSQAWG